jgi:hypothetical protein
MKTKQDTITITPLVPFNETFEVPGMTEEQRINFNLLKDIEASEETAEYLIIRNYARKVE